MAAMKTVVVGMSGGVDSSVSAFLLKEMGYRVIALFMRNWEEGEGCTAEADYEDVVRVASKLNIPYYSVNFAKEYKEQVFSEFLRDYEAGLTPNPDVLCNKEIKFQVFLEKALSLGADYLATGHYCRRDEKGRLLKGLDPLKDQSYFLHLVDSSKLQKVLFPLGALEKKEVRQIAKKAGLATSEKKDSTGICFIGKRDFKTFLSQYISIKKGNFETLDHKVVGEHDGAFFYTLGQRKGMALGGEGDAWYVVGKDLSRNVVYVERGADHPALFTTTLELKEIFWQHSPPPSYPYRCSAKVRYRQEDVPCTLVSDRKVLFDEPQRAVTPGQFAVFYDKEYCLGGGQISATF